jgi:ubiquinone/menaquinone biosynthesis C-methylase UbiE
VSKRRWENWDRGEIAKEIDQYWHSSKGEQEWRNRLMADMSNVLGRDAALLEVGCGSGAIYEEMLKRGIVTSGSYTGGDISRKLLDIAHNRFPTTQFIAMDIFKLPYRDGAQPVVLCISVLQHLPDYRPALRELARVTGSTLYVASWFTKAKHDNIRLVKSQWGPEFYENTYSLQRFLDFVADIEGVRNIDVQCLYPSRYSLDRHGITKSHATFRILIAVGKNANTARGRSGFRE